MLLFFLSLLFWSIGYVILWRIPLCEGSADSLSVCSCSVIIPARNEEPNLPVLLASLNRQTVAPMEIIVCDDHSSDRTAEIASAAGVSVVAVPEKPADWTGKTWALWQGTAVARGDLFLFLDADTWLEPDGLERIIGTWQKKKGAITIQPFATSRKFYESLSAFFHLMMMAGVKAFTLFGNNIKPAGGFGPCLLCHRDDYFALDGHRRIRSRVLENMALGKAFLENGIHLHCYGGKLTINIRMYPGGLKELIEGWTKGFASGAQKTGFFWMLLVVLWVCGMFQAFQYAISAVTNPFSSLSAAMLLLYLAYVGQLARVFRQIADFARLPALFFPVYLIFFVLVFCWSFVKIYGFRTVQWKGRHIKR